MRIIDVACATSFAITSMLLLLAANPQAMSQQAHDIAARSTSEGLIQSYLAHNGLPFLGSSDFDSICASAKSFSNQSAHISISVDGRTCPAQDPPPQIDRTASTTLDLNGRMVTIEAWTQEGKQ